MKKPPNKAEKDHMARVASLGCQVCRNEGYGFMPAEVHHIFYAYGKRAHHYDTFPLCPSHHRHGDFGEAIHNGGKTFQLRYGTEQELLAQTRELLRRNQET